MGPRGGPSLGDGVARELEVGAGGLWFGHAEELPERRHEGRVPRVEQDRHVRRRRPRGQQEGSKAAHRYFIAARRRTFDKVVVRQRRQLEGLPEVHEGLHDGRAVDAGLGALGHRCDDRRRLLLHRQKQRPQRVFLGYRQETAQHHRLCLLLLLRRPRRRRRELLLLRRRRRRSVRHYGAHRRRRKLGRLKSVSFSSSGSQRGTAAAEAAGPPRLVALQGDLRVVVVVVVVLVFFLEVAEDEVREAEALAAVQARRDGVEEPFEGFRELGVAFQEARPAGGGAVVVGGGRRVAAGVGGRNKGEEDADALEVRGGELWDDALACLEVGGALVDDVPEGGPSGRAGEGNFPGEVLEESQADVPDFRRNLPGQKSHLAVGVPDGAQLVSRLSCRRRTERLRRRRVLVFETFAAQKTTTAAAPPPHVFKGRKGRRRF
mmetsp:Transcript_10012/g.32598  ORF Transcript_10012/g.32598 Transcript_10012/m.32598 type:complete len:433 (+) Transcript_10012:1228-2526(+)